MAATAMLVAATAAHAATGNRCKVTDPTGTPLNVRSEPNGKIIGKHRSTGIGRPRFWERARYYGEEKRLAAALDAAEVKDETGSR